MAQVTQEKVENVQVDPKTGYEQRVIEYRPAPWDAFATRLARLVLLIGGIVVVLLLVRIAFVALGANPQNDFAALIYRITDIFVGPFVGILSSKTVDDITFDIPAAVALVIYSILSLILARLILVILIGPGRIRSIRRVQRID